MTLQGIIFSITDCLPQRVKVALIGKRSSPGRFANAVHSMLNRLPAERYPILPCRGPLKGFRMRVDWKTHRSFAYGSWEPEVVQSIEEHVTAGMTVLDIGAQSGFYSLLLSKLVGPTGRVIAFEPLPANVRLLEENIRLNNLTNVDVRHEAVTERSGPINFEFPGLESNLVAGPVLPGDSQGIFSVEGIALDDCFSDREFPLQFIKMDVEGAEVEVLRGALNALNTCHPDMMIELHDMDKYPGSHPAVVLVEDLGYKIRWLGEIASTAHIFVQWPKQKTDIPSTALDEDARGIAKANPESAT
jgi:FkbM family methyltransferase